MSFPADSMPSTPRASLFDLVTAADALTDAPPALSRRSSLSRLFDVNEVPTPLVIPEPLPISVASERRGKRSQKFVFTVYAKEGENITFTQEKFLNFFTALTVKYVILGIETCPTTSRQHIQGFVIFNNARYFDAVRTLDLFLEYHVHVEIAKGSPTQNFDYCSKEGNFKEVGARPVRNPHAKGINYTLESLHEFGVYLRRFPQIPVDQIEMYFDLISDMRESFVEILYINI